MEKRGQGLSIQAIILIILAVLVLIFIIVGFTVGWTKVLPFIQPSNNVNELGDKCDIACNTDSQFDYCTVLREVNFEESITDTGIVSGEKYTCQRLSEVDEFGIAECPGLCPPPVVSDDDGDGNGDDADEPPAGN